MQDYSWDCFWNNFTLDEPNQAKGGILYCLRYSKERLEAHREQVIGGLIRLGHTCNAKRGLFDRLFKFKKNPKKVESAVRSYPVLLEELSTINNALKYHELGFGRYRNLRELREGILGLYGQGNLDENIRKIVRELKISQEQGKEFRAYEREQIADLEMFVK